MMAGVSSVGKRGELLMRFERDRSGRSILREMYRRAPVIVQQALYFDEQLPQLPCVYILSAGGPVVEGDEYDYEIALKEGSCAHISTGAATKVA
ncbi:MAG: urease accessory protein UreD, partial [Alistipes sp.]|nr:urease accessory protein UreD [Alistipes sp.]